MSTQPKPKLTVKEYLEIERKAEFKSEFHDGEMFAMSGVSSAHNLITGKLMRALDSRLEDRGCSVFFADMRVAVDPARVYFYPDIAVVCGKPIFRDDYVDTLENPVFIAEVLSPSTEAFDRGRKFAQYRTIASLKEYMLVSQDRVEIELFSRSAEGIWMLSSANRMEDVVRLASLDCEIPLSEIYKRVLVA